ncbi:gamma carbonic anhydrase family protein [Parvularcula maris]|uniref:Gamma carbonic anhydrase family protein n=1 Tax=Parvularcula maris TaxID=2965077 RepID=A0A9X2LBF0_9PROT|nr:gamma carbonic anhydrase family protein [Parvularcula maris]MCQ8186388.1 gamma carbonic anhydrase family protein [Parvularcula maris]
MNTPLPAPLILPFHGNTPKIDPSAFVAPGAVLIGDVEIGPDASVWYGCILRGDTNKIVVGRGSNVQDGTICHVDKASRGGTPVLIGENVLVGHRCMLHGCRVEDGGFVGMGATMLDEAVVESGAFLAAGAFLSNRKRVPSGELWGGMPARKLRDLKEGEDKMALMGAAFYVEEARQHREAIEQAGG